MALKNSPLTEAVCLQIDVGIKGWRKHHRSSEHQESESKQRHQQQHWLYEDRYERHALNPEVVIFAKVTFESSIPLLPITRATVAFLGHINCHLSWWCVVHIKTSQITIASSKPSSDKSPSHRIEHYVSLTVIILSVVDDSSSRTRSKSLGQASLACCWCSCVLPVELSVAWRQLCSRCVHRNLAFFVLNEVTPTWSIYLRSVMFSKASAFLVVY